VPKKSEQMPAEQRQKISQSLISRDVRSKPKKCPSCGETKHRDEFGYRRNGHTRSLCKKCGAAKAREWAKRNPDRVKAHNRAINLRRHYGLTEDQYGLLLKAQDGKCRICGSSGKADSDFPLVIDHCHASSRIRGLLCSPCNSGIGHLQEDISVLRAAIEYLVEGAAPDSLYATPGMPSGVEYARRLKEEKDARQ
jgi:hypothetical protein